ncbi:MAG: fructose-bisphosphate aldolase [Nanoarchaeota archaeon]|nr:fructose-bisphosphate aldolase [Nanoarchaeota archaeon]MBU1031275.1 fructose-bisphosphate aldolase [Nanoarchaeota archaeon]MBU1849506.1 fructose-bisphosphate aldolase [Nanoarchaeota archaeon]
MVIQINKLLTNKKGLFLAYDHGLEHGPIEFNLKNVDPNYILDIALEGHFNGVIMQAGLAEKYHQDYYKDLPLIVKLNGKTTFHSGEPEPALLCSVERAMRLGASGVAYTIYVGSEHQQKMMKEFAKVVEVAHDYGLPVIAFMYPRGAKIPNSYDNDILAYSARMALEMGADMIKIDYNQNIESFKWVVKNAGKCKILVKGGDATDDRSFLQKIYDCMQIGVCGFAIGRQVWKHPKPFSMTKAIQSIVFHNKIVDEAMKFLE